MPADPSHQTTAIPLISVYGEMRRRIRAAGSQKAWAQAIGVSEAYLSDVLNGRRDPGESILGPLGLRKEVRYVKVSRGAKP